MMVLLKWLRPLLIKLGINYRELTLILDLLSTIDKRKQRAIHSSNNSKISSRVSKIISYGLMGVMLALIIWMIKLDTLAVGMLMTIHFAMMVMITITELTDVIIGSNLQLSLYTMPIKPIVITQARVLFVIRILTYYTTLIIGASIFVFAINRGVISALLLMIFTILSNIFVVVIASLLYLLVFKFFDDEKLKDIIGYIQLTLTLLTSLSYVFFAKITSVLSEVTYITLKWYYVFTPPLWYMSWFSKSQAPFVVIYRVLSIVIPVGLLLWYTLSLAKNFESHLIKLKVVANRQIKKAKLSPIQKYANFITANQQEFMGFNFAFLNIKRDKKLKQIILANIGFAVFYPMLGFFNSMGTQFYVFFSFFMIIQASMNVLYSESAAGAWVYECFPVEDYFYFKRGVQKSFIFTLVSLVGIALCGLQFYSDGIKGLLTTLANIMVMLIIIRCYIRKIHDRHVFSVAIEDIKENRIFYFGDALIVMGAMSILGVVHYFIYRYTFLFSAILIAYLLLLYTLYFTDFLKTWLSGRLK